MSGRIDMELRDVQGRCIVHRIGAMQIESLTSLSDDDRSTFDRMLRADDERLYGRDAVEAWDASDAYRRNFLFRALDDEGSFVGVVTGICSLGLGYVHELYVAQQAQARGIGSALLKRAEDFCAERGARRLALRTHREGAAVPFYEHRGWRVEFENPAWFGRDVFVQMRKDVS
jgi:GNAT superfamily N-acetyltransferase